MSQQQRSADREDLRDLYGQVVAWDPLGLIALGAPRDEYDCLPAPLVAGLRDGSDLRQVAQALRDRMAEHFGDSPWRCDAGSAEGLRGG